MPVYPEHPCWYQSPMGDTGAGGGYAFAFFCGKLTLLKPAQAVMALCLGSLSSAQKGNSNTQLPLSAQHQIPLPPFKGKPRGRNVFEQVPSNTSLHPSPAAWNLDDELGFRVHPIQKSEFCKWDFALPSQLNLAATYKSTQLSSQWIYPSFVSGIAQSTHEFCQLGG